MGRRLHCKTARFLWEKASPKPWKKRYKYPYESQMKRRNSPINVKLRWESIKAHGLEKKPFKKFMRLPKELQLKIWNNALSKPGIHFFAVVVTPPDKEWNPMDPHAWKPPFILTDWLCEKKGEFR
ncbi:hypothetical protein UCRPA7_2147 [Phaeoacremonium minimum UCRPA7]|uniref:2EXR domain-containing protein n=1 Tax=Phaeoacremonium minimum (strain UCR-PA7) TaxID=1286976 RepID=R8BSP2_PHAM7|nr:hypothetical protein UCRPA7_2147 [Phaeoacremonium minimum UCRPA7]EOO02339.1 hypothetical protein UCRPA7_2147 [Phaeoacremonium minimum UCRPA7]